MKHLFIINPSAGKYDHTGELKPMIESFCRARCLNYEIIVSEKEGMVRSATRRVAVSGEKVRVYVCGGDGTLNEAVNGAAGYPNVALTIIPCGTGNDFVRSFSAPGAFNDLEAVVNGKEVLLDLICCQGQHYAINICSMGLDARIGTQVGRYKRIPLVSGHGAFLISTFVNVLRGVHRHYLVELDGQVVDARQTMICIANGRWYGGGFYACPDAELDDGLLDVLLVKKMSRFTVGRMVGKYRAGKYREIPQYISHYRCKKIAIQCDRPSDINLDGELLMGAEVTFEVLPKALRFICPEGLDFHRTEPKP